MAGKARESWRRPTANRPCRHWTRRTSAHRVCLKGQDIQRASPPRNKIFTWTGNDWREDSAAPSVSDPPVISTEDVLFTDSGLGEVPRIYRLATDSKSMEFYLQEKLRQSVPLKPI